MKRISLVLAAVLLAVAQGVAAHGGAKHDDGKAEMDDREKMPWGIAGDAADAVHTVSIGMSDAMHFTPDLIRVHQGETVRFDVRNDGEVMHELVIGTADVLAEHAALMKRFPNMEHSAPYMIHVPPGTRGEIVWTFNRSGEFDFACLIPGHLEAGMVGRIEVATE